MSHALARPDDSPQRRFLTIADDLHRAHFIAWAIALGEAAIDTLYDGELGRYYDRSSGKDDAFELLLAEHADELAELHLSGAALRRYIVAWATWRQLPAALRTGLGVVKLNTLATLPATSERVRFARLAAEEELTAEQLDAAVAAFRAQEGLVVQARGRRRKPEALKLTAAAGRTLGKVAAIESKALAGLEPDHLDALRLQLVALRDGADVLLQRLGR